MKSLQIKARAKINLSLDVLGKRPNGYHELRMIMQTIGLHDTIELQIIDRGIEVECANALVPSGRDNIAFKAAELLINECKIQKGIRIVINKSIPVAAGLAGGSTDAAAVLKGMNRLFSLGLSDACLMNFGKRLGADVPYCIVGGTMLAEGIGEILTPLADFGGVSIILVKPRIEVSTAWVYKSLDLQRIVARPDTDLLISLIKEKKPGLLARNMVNVLETVTAKKYAVIEDIKARLVELGAAGSMMSGSGPSVFGIFTSGDSAQSAFDSLDKSEYDCFLTKTI